MLRAFSTFFSAPEACPVDGAVPRVRRVDASAFRGLVPALASLLAETVNAGASLGFVAPVAQARTRDYWMSLLPELRAGSRLLLVATLDDGVVGAGQLWMPQWATALHRAEVHKVFVDREVRGRGIGALLMAALHDEARERGRSLMVLHTRQGEAPVRFYRRLGYKDLGVLPGGIRGAAGERRDLLTLYRDLDSR